MLSSDVLKFKASSRGETCKKLGIPVVSERYVDESSTLGIKQVLKYIWIFRGFSDRPLLAF